MELAKIRNKARREEQEAATETAAIIQPDGMQDEPQALPHAAPESAQDVAQPIAEAITHVVPAATTVPLRAFSPARRFDPLAVILAGRASAEVEGTVLDREEADAVTTTVVKDFEEFLCFMLAGEEYGVNIMEIKEIIKPRELTEVPRTPAFVDGVLSLRGVIVPVIAMRSRLSMPPAEERSAERVVIVRCGDGLTGLRVDRITGVVRIADSSRESTPGVLEGAARDFVSGIGRSDGRMIIILDVDSVMDFNFEEVP